MAKTTARQILASDITERQVRLFWAKVDESGECWIWRGAKEQHGYGRVRIGDQTLPAHRVSAALAFGCVGETVEVCHHCDVQSCVRPAHLFLGSHAENMADAKVKGRVRGRFSGSMVCAKGLHALSGDNLIVRPNGTRLCRVCRKKTERRWNLAISSARAAKHQQIDATCAACGKTWTRLTVGRPSRYCSPLCRGRAGRAARARSAA